MPLSKDLNDLEYQKFEEDSAGNVRSRVTTDIVQLVTSNYDYISVAYPTTTSEVYTYKTGGSGGTTVATVTITYTDTTKDNILTVEVV